ncbi:MAG: FHA domain-containing protein [Acidimicrobiales bacterium]
MPESLLTILKFLLLALVWLFFLRVLRTAWVEMRKPRRGGGDVPLQQKRTADPRPAYRLKVIEPTAQRGKMYELSDELTVGRAAGCGVSLDADNFASKLHARVFREDGRLWIEDLGSTNGTYVNAERIVVPVLLKKGDRLQVGQTVLEVAK